jgi:hypothetical protein
MVHSNRRVEESLRQGPLDVPDEQNLGTPTGGVQKLRASTSGKICPSSTESEEMR